MKKTGATLSYNEIVDNIKMFYFAGHETTATLISYCIHFMIKHPEMFKKIQEEVDLVVGNNKEITLEHIEKLVYLQCFIKETLRRKSPLAFLNRATLEETQVGKYIIPAGMRVMILLDAINRDKKYWDKPDEFIPERWFNIDESKIKSDIHYIPFSMGPRICIGQRLAREEAIVFLILFSKYFDIKGDPNIPDPVPDYVNTLFRPKNIYTTISRRVPN